MPSFSLIVFYAFSAVLLFAALGVVLARNTVHAALLLVVAFAASAGVWMLLYAEFLAIVLVLVYVGAVMVLFLFVLMMLDTSGGSLRRWRLLPVGVAIIVAVQIGVFLKRDAFVHSAKFAPPEVVGDNTRMLGAVLYTDYVYVFELAAVLLLVAIIAAAALTLRRRRGVKYNDPAEQMRAEPSRRVRLVNMPPVIAKASATTETDDDTAAADDKTANDKTETAKSGGKQKQQ
ncbi:MAG: NADH-quinone oxidoreductase subunit J [Gammaproteobacteria bacterium]